MNLGTMDNLDATSESEAKTMYSCLHCKKVFNHVGNRTRHQKKCKIRPNSSASEVPSETEITFKYTNRWCDHAYSRKNNMSRHVSTCQQKSNNLKKCFICKKEFS